MLLVLPPIDLPTSAPAACEEWICGTAQEWEVDAAGPAVRGGFEDYCPESVDTPHFRIHYAIEGQHMIPGWPDPTFLQDLGAMLEDELQYFHETLDLSTPPSDGSLGGGNGLIDCYCWNFDEDRRFWAGFARRLDYVNVGCPDSMFGLFCLNVSSMTGRTPAYIRKISAHELFHLVQYGISGGQSWWFAESTAEWAAGRASTSGPIYLNTYWFLATPYLSLYDYGSRSYGARLFWDALERLIAPNLPADIVRATCELWDYDALISGIEERGFGTTEVLSRFAEWNAFTGTRDDGEHYAKGETLIDVRLQAEHTSFPVVDAAIDSASVAQAAGSNYIRFIGPGTRTGLRIEIHGSAAAPCPRIISILAMDSEGQRKVAQTVPDTNGFASVTIPRWSEVQDVTLIVTNGFPNKAEGDLQFTYSGIPTDGPFPSLAPETETPLTIFPNPSPGISTIQFNVNEFAQTNVAVFDVAGRRIVDLANGTLEPGVYRSRFEVPQESGIQPSAGVYFVRLQTGGTTTTEKVTVLRAQ